MSASVADSSAAPAADGPARVAGGWEEDLGCPGCGYNLRGLPPRADMPGVVVDCPECGMRSDVALLAQRRWDKPWNKAPGFSWMTLPVAWLLLGSVGVLMSAGVLSSAMGLSGTGSWLSMLGLVAVLLAGWVLLLVWVYLRNGGIVGVLFSLLAHVVFAGYVGGLVLVVGGVIGVISVTMYRGRTNQPVSWLSVAIGVGLCLLGVGLFVGGRICEKQVAGYCIRLHLRRGPRG